jgi:hypothetical protein
LNKKKNLREMEREEKEKEKKEENTVGHEQDRTVQSRRR